MYDSSPRRSPDAGAHAGPTPDPGAALEALEHSQPDALSLHEAADPARDVPTHLGRNVRWNFVGQFWALGVTLVATPVIINRLGPDAYGIIAALAIVTNYMAFLDLGLSQGSIKFVAEFAAERRWDRVRLVFWTSLAMYMLLAVLATVAMIGLSPLAASRWFRIPPELQSAAVNSFYVGAAGVFLVLVNFAPTSLIRGLERFDLVNKVGMLVGTLQPLLTLLLVVAGASLPLIVVGNVAVLLITVGLNFAISRRLFPGMGAPVWSRTAFLKLARFSGYLAAACLLIPLAMNAEKLLLAGSISIAALTYYMVPQSLLARLVIIPASFSSALFPRFAAIHSSGSGHRNVDLNVEVAKALVYLFAPILTVLFLFGDTLLTWWMGPTFASESGAALRILAIASLVQALAWTPHVLVQAVGRTDITFRIYLIQVVLYLPVAYFAVRAGGVEGAAWAWLLRVALDIVLVWTFARRISGLSFAPVVADARVRWALAGVTLMSAGSLLPALAPVARYTFLWLGGLLAVTSVAAPLRLLLASLLAGRMSHHWESA